MTHLHGIAGSAPFIVELKVPLFVYYGIFGCLLGQDFETNLVWKTLTLLNHTSVMWKLETCAVHV